MIKRALCLLLLPQVAFAYSNIVFLVSGTTWTLPADWNNADNQIECVGRGGKGSARNSAGTGGFGGGGGAYAIKSNVNLGAGPTVVIQVGTSTSAVATFIKDSSGTIQVQADFGADATTSGGGAAGQGSNCIPTIGAFSGGGSFGITGHGGEGLGGGGGAGPFGSGTAQVISNIQGGDADGGQVIGPTTQGAVGNSGAEWDGSHGSGSGGAGASGGGSRNGGGGGQFGGGGGGSNSGASGLGGGGSDGLIVVQWNPSGGTPPPTTVPSQFFNWFSMIVQPLLYIVHKTNTHK